MREKSLHIYVSGARVKELRAKKRLKQEDLGDKLGVSRQTINTWEKKETVKLAPEIASKLASELEVSIKDLTNVKDYKEEPYNIPFYDALATAGLTMYQADQSPVSQPSETVNPGTWFRSATAAMRVYGDSMYPKYKSGCIIAMKEVFDKDEIIYGEDYVVETSEQRVLKRVMKSEKGDDYIELTSINPQTDSRGKAIYGPKDFHLSKVRRIYKVLGQILYETGGDTIIHRDMA